MKPKILVSGCVFGQKVRYQGESKEDKWVSQTLSKFVSIEPLCPEVEMGLGVPRETMRLVASEEGPRLVTNKTQKDFTDIAQQTTRTLIDGIDDKINGFILMGRSPSCGLERVKVYDKNNIPSGNGTGFFAHGLIERFPKIPKIEVGRLSDPEQKHQFLVQVFTLFKFNSIEKKISRLQEFHSSNKFLLMAHSPEGTTKLGRLAANSDRRSVPDVFTAYQAELSKALQQAPSEGRLRNALSHMYGYLKDSLPAERKSNLVRLIESEKLSLNLELLKHENSSAEVEFLSKQTLFEPYPKDLR